MTIVLDMHYFSKMVDNKESSANWFDLFDLAMVIWEMVVVTSLGRVTDFATLYYIAEHDIEEAGKKKMDQRAYLVVMATIDGAD